MGMVQWTLAYSHTVENHAKGKKEKEMNVYHI